MNHQNILESAKKSLKEAIDLDNAQEHEKAYAKYQRALEQFLVVLKYEKNEATKKALMKRVQEYMERAETLKREINNSKKPVGMGDTTGGGDAKDEKGKLSGALADAIIKEKPNVKWSDVAGLEAAKQTLKEAVILPVKFPQLFKGKRKPWKGILLYGPPGTGKSFLAKAVATEADSTFISVSSADLVSKWQGESEKLVRTLFSMAREQSPAIVFVDEVDSLCGARGEGENEASRRIKTEFLVQMGGVGNGTEGVLVLGATNLPWALDPAMRRRFEKRVYIALPEAEARTYMFRLNLGDTTHNLTDKDFKDLGVNSHGYSGADISIVVREAMMLPVRNLTITKFFRETDNGYYEPVVDYPPCPYCPMQLSTMPITEKFPKCKRCQAIRMTLYDVPGSKIAEPSVSATHCRQALEGTNPSVSPKELTKFNEWTEEFGQEG